MGDAYDSKLKKTYTGKTFERIDGDAETQWRFMRNDTPRERDSKIHATRFVQSCIEGFGLEEGDSSISSPQIPSKEKEVSLSKPAFTLDASTNNDTLSGSTTAWWKFRRILMGWKFW